MNRISTFTRIQNAFSLVRRDRRGNVWVEYLILVACLGLAGIQAIKALSSDVNGAATTIGGNFKAMEKYSGGK